MKLVAGEIHVVHFKSHIFIKVIFIYHKLFLWILHKYIFLLYFVIYKRSRDTEIEKKKITSFQRFKQLY